MSLIIVASLVLCPAGESTAQSRADVQIVADVELVQVPVIVFDEKGAVATNLTKSDFRVLEDGVEQQLMYCEKERQSVSFVILADQSSSVTNKIPFIQEAARSVVNPDLPKDQFHDEFAVFGIETRVRRLASFTQDQEDLERKLPDLITPTNGSTALFDGIYVGVTTAEREAANKRRAVIIISDGGDNHSRYNLRETRKLLEEADMPVFAVMAGPAFELPGFLAPPASKGKPSGGLGGKSKPSLSAIPLSGAGEDYVGPAERRGPHNLKDLTEVTGGGVFTARSLEDLPRIVRTIGLAVRYRYVLTYKPNRNGKPSPVNGGENGWHKLRIELLPKDKFAGYGMPYYKRGYNRMD